MNDIRADFAEDGFPELSAGERNNFHGSMFGKPASGATHSLSEALLSTSDKLDDLRETLNRYLSKFYYGRHSLEEWERRYCFPDQRTFLIQLKSLGLQENDLLVAKALVINRNRQSILEWTRKNLIRRRSNGAPGGADAVVYVQGTVGCGKSTLNKYITTILFDEFRLAKVVPSRVECLKLRRYAQTKPNGASEDFSAKERRRLTFIKFLKASIARDIIHMSRSEFKYVDGERRLVSGEHCLDFPDVDGAQFAEFVDQAASHNGQPSDEAERVLRHVRRLFHTFGRKDPQSRGRLLRRNLLDADEFTLDVIIGYFKEHGFSFCLLFDGFDYIDAADFYMKSPQTEIIETLADWIVDEECGIDVLGSDTTYPNVSLTIRRNTRSIIGSRHNHIYYAAKSRSAYVLAPSMRNVFLGLLREIRAIAASGTRTHKEKELLKALNRAREGIKGELEMTSGMSLGSLFNGNVRNQINYTKNVIYELAAGAIMQSTGVKNVDAYQLIGLMNFEIANFMKQKSYRLVDMLLYSSGARFSNFVTVRGPDHLPEGADPPPLTLDDISDNNLDSGYVGNVLNYHIGYYKRGDEAYLLEKIRILELLRRRGLEEARDAEKGHGTESWLRERFAAKNWPISVHFKMSLCLLVREGMLEIIESHREAIFSPLPLGVLAVERLIGKLVYLENVYFGTLIPNWMRRVSDDVDRPTSLRRWITASLFHVWLLLRLVRHAEGIGADGGSARDRFIFDRMRKGVEGNVLAMIKDPEHWSGSPDQQPEALAHRKILHYIRSIVSRRARPAGLGGSDRARKATP